MAAEFQFPTASPSKTVPLTGGLVEEAENSNDLISAWGTRPVANYGSALTTPGAQLLRSRTLFSSPQPTPTGCTREDTLQSMVRALQEKLTTELHFRDEAQIKTTEAAPLSNEYAEAAAEALKREERVGALEAKLRRAQHTLQGLGTARADLERSEAAVLAAQRGVDGLESEGSLGF
ncbi:hypothetical protein H632_c913p0, partial [Helicosporidium sp. ATCC 50920]